MTETQQLAARIRALSGKLKANPSTLSRKLFGSGARLGELEAGSSMTFSTYARVEAAVSAMEQQSR